MPHIAVKVNMLMYTDVDTVSKYRLLVRIVLDRPYYYFFKTLGSIDPEG